jgi:DNA-binding Xre family transcriptional regulator
MGLRYKMDMVEALRSKGWNTGRLRRENEEARERGEKAPGISEASLQALRQGRPVSWANLEILCKKLQCQPGDFLEYVEDEAGNAN